MAQSLFLPLTAQFKYHSPADLSFSVLVTSSDEVVHNPFQSWQPLFLMGTCGHKNLSAPCSANPVVSSELEGCVSRSLFPLTGKEQGE